MESIRIAVADGTVAESSWVYSVAEELDIEIIAGPGKTPEEVAKLTDGCDAIIISLHRMSAEVIAAFDPSIKIIGRAGVGLDTIDLVAAKNSKVAVVNQPTYAIHEVSNHAVAMMLALHRTLFQANQGVRSLGWGGATDYSRVHSLQDSTIGVIGCGRIGQSTISKLQPFVKRVLGFDPGIKSQMPGVEMVNSLDELLKLSQMITLHTPYMPSTHHLIGAEQIAKMAKGSIIVNVSRGGLIDEDALAAALHSGYLSGAGLDVFETEPLPLESALRSAPNLILTPHTAWYSESSGPRLIEWTVRDVFSYISNGSIEHGAFAVGPF